MRFLGWFWGHAFFIVMFMVGIVVATAGTMTLTTGELVKGLPPTWLGLLCIPAGMVITSVAILVLRWWDE